MSDETRRSATMRTSDVERAILAARQATGREAIQVLLNPKCWDELLDWCWPDRGDELVASLRICGVIVLKSDKLPRGSILVRTTGDE